MGKIFFIVGFGLSLVNGILLGQSSSYWLNGAFSGAGIAGTNCTGYGFNALFFQGIANYNSTATGFKAMGEARLPNNCTSNGAFSLFSAGNYLGGFAGTDNTAIGNKSLFLNQGGSKITSIGYQSMYFNQTGGSNVAIGVETLFSNKVTNNNTAGGYQALYNNGNTGTGIYNTAAGTYALFNNDNTSQNTAIGNGALYSQINGGSNTAMGYNALYNNGLVGSWGAENIAFGFKSLFTNTLGNYNIAVGKNALYSQVNGWYNIAIGDEAGSGNSSGTENIEIGKFANSNNLTGSWNVCIGNYALLNNLNSYNVAVGTSALTSNISGSNNTAVGGVSYSGGSSSGSGNTTFGAYSALNGNYTNASALGFFAIVNASDKIRLGNAFCTTVESQNAPVTVSDGRFKTNVSEEDVKGLDFINRLKPVLYNFDNKKYADFITSNLPDSIRQAYLTKDFSFVNSKRLSGFIAQELEQAAKESGYEFSGLIKPSNKNDNYSISYATLVVPLTKALQEQQSLIEKMEEDGIKNLIDSEKLNKRLNSKNLPSAQVKTDKNKNFEMHADPNPFKKQSTISYVIPISTNKATLIIKDLTGKEIITLDLKEFGESSITISNKMLEAGIYIYSIICDNELIGSKYLIVDISL